MKLASPPQTITMVAILVLHLGPAFTTAMSFFDGNDEYHHRRGCNLAIRSRHGGRLMLDTALISSPRSWVHASKRATVVLKCVVCAEKPYKVWWRKDGANLPENSPRIRASTRHAIGTGRASLKIKSFRESDFGIYRCNVYVNGSMEEAGADVQVSGHAYPAVFDHPSEWTDTTFELSWRANCSVASPIIDYRLEFRRSSASYSDWIAVNVPASDVAGLTRTFQTHRRAPTLGEFHQVYVLKGLAKGENYETKVSSRNAYGTSAESEVFHFRTLDPSNSEGIRNENDYGSFYDHAVLFEDVENMFEHRPELDAGEPSVTRRSQGLMGNSAATTPFTSHVAVYPTILLLLKFVSA